MRVGCGWIIIRADAGWMRLDNYPCRCGSDAVGFPCRCGLDAVDNYPCRCGSDAVGFPWIPITDAVGFHLFQTVGSENSQSKMWWKQINPMLLRPWISRLEDWFMITKWLEIIDRRMRFAHIMMRFAKQTASYDWNGCGYSRISYLDNLSS